MIAWRLEDFNDTLKDHPLNKTKHTLWVFIWKAALQNNNKKKALLVDLKFNAHRDDGSQSLYGPGAQCDVGENLLGKARFPKDPIGVVPDLWKINPTFRCYGWEP